jgi:hypothetical protein
MNNKFYAGIGSRETPEDICELMFRLATDLSFLGYTLRSGGAGGADEAFEMGARSAKGKMEIYLPWKNFRGITDGILVDDDYEAQIIAEMHHPAWKFLGRGAKKLMTRNTFQALSLKEDVANSAFVLCWTADGAETKTTRETGGTGQCIRIAIAHNIPVFNLKNEDALERFNSFLDTFVVSD